MDERQVDLLLGTWAEQNVPSLTAEEMESYEDILNLETLDIFNFITGNAKPPAFVDTPMMARLQVRERCSRLETTRYPTVDSLRACDLLLRC